MPLYLHTQGCTFSGPLTITLNPIHHNTPTRHTIAPGKICQSINPEMFNHLHTCIWVPPSNCSLVYSSSNRPCIGLSTSPLVVGAISYSVVRLISRIVERHTTGDLVLNIFQIYQSKFGASLIRPLMTLVLLPSNSHQRTWPLHGRRTWVTLPVTRFIDMGP